MQLRPRGGVTVQRAEPSAPPGGQLFELFAHAGYGLLLVPFVIGLHGRHLWAESQERVRSTHAQQGATPARLPG